MVATIVVAAVFALGTGLMMRKMNRNYYEQRSEQERIAREAFDSGRQYQEKIDKAIPAPPDTITLESATGITMDQNDKFVFLRFKIEEQHFEPMINIYHDVDSKSVVILKVNNIQRSYKLPGEINWPVLWRFDHTEKQLSFEFERVNQVTNANQYWSTLDKDFTKTNSHVLAERALSSGLGEYQVNFNECQLLLETPFLFHENIQFAHTYGMHAYTNYPLGTYYKFHIKVADNTEYEFKFFPIPREVLILESRLLKNVIKEIVSTGEKQKIYAEAAAKSTVKILQTDLWGLTNVKFERTLTMMENNGKEISLKDVIKSIPEDKKYLKFIAISTTVTAFLQPLIYLCLFTEKMMKLMLINTNINRSIFRPELLKMIGNCSGRLEVLRIHPGDPEITPEDDKKRFPSEGEVAFHQIKEITDNIVNYKQDNVVKCEDLVFVTADTDFIDGFRTFLEDDYGYKPENIYSFAMEPLIVIKTQS